MWIHLLNSRPRASSLVPPCLAQAWDVAGVPSTCCWKERIDQPSNPQICWKLTVPAEITATFYGSEHKMCGRHVPREDAPKIYGSGAGTTAFFVRLRESF